MVGTSRLRREKKKVFVSIELEGDARLDGYLCMCCQMNGSAMLSMTTEIFFPLPPWTTNLKSSPKLLSNG